MCIVKAKFVMADQQINFIGNRCASIKERDATQRHTTWHRVTSGLFQTLNWSIEAPIFPHVHKLVFQMNRDFCLLKYNITSQHATEWILSYAV